MNHCTNTSSKSIKGEKSSLGQIRTESRSILWCQIKTMNSSRVRNYDGIEKFHIWKLLMARIAKLKQMPQNPQSKRWNCWKFKFCSALRVKRIHIIVYGKIITLNEIRNEIHHGMVHAFVERNRKCLLNYLLNQLSVKTP